MCWGLREKINHIPFPSRSSTNWVIGRGISQVSINIQYFVDESVSMDKIGLSNSIPPLSLPPLPIPGIGITHPKENIQRKHLPGELQSSVAAPQVETERCSSHLPLEGRPGLQQVHMKTGSEWDAYAHRQWVQKRELSVCVCLCVCVHNDSPMSPSENTIFLLEK